MAQANLVATEQSGIKAYGYRWIVLLFFFLINALMQVQWITFAPITSEAVTFYKVSALQIDLLSLIFMLVYIFVSIPASYVIDTYGIRVGIGIGALLLGIFGLLKGIFGASYGLVVLAQVGLAVGQPFVLNAVTKVGVRWFPLHERATQAGISVLAQFVGIIVAMAATPLLLQTYGMEKMLRIYGLATFAGAALFLLFNREHPPTPPCPPGHDERIPALAGLKHIVLQKDMRYLLLIFFIIAGATLMIGGIVGASILPVLSDKLRKRKFFILISTLFAVPGLVGLTFTGNYTVLLAACFSMGFFLLAGGPICYQYSAEVSYPAPEATSQGLLLFAGQISGILFVFGMDVWTAAGASKTPAMILFIALTLLNIVFILKLKESKLVRTDEI
ncbi:MAG: MFS transporter [Desulfobacterales bacterium]|nr:MFS transporter [Desulfobacterales bacterium]